ncbi:MAG TPA: YraN family protein [Acidiferrobacterales bacterium]|nr:YraN family protein [Acidiferrobacterales bacterium]
MAEPLSGAQAEDLACAHLERAGLRLLTRNYRCPQGEIDLVMDDHDALVFVEVRYRRTNAFGTPAETVDRRKQARLQAAAGHYLLTHSADRPCRFDVVAVSGRDTHIEWVRDAFGTEN